MTYKMLQIQIAIIITVSWTGNTVYSVIAGPRNTVAKLGDRVELECSTAKEDPIIWEFSPAGSHNKTFIYHSDILTQGLQDKYAIDKRETGRYNLIMNSTDLSFGGTYICSDSDEQSTLSSRSSELIVIVADPACSTNSSAVVIEGDCIHIHVVCTISYAGNWVPVMECSKSSGQIIESKVYTRYSTAWTSSLMTQLTLNDNGVVFKCNTTFKSMPINDRNTDDDIVPPVYEYIHTWNFTAYVSNATTATVADRGNLTSATYVPAVADDRANSTLASVTEVTVKLALIIIGALLLCLPIAFIIYKICKKGNARPDIVPEAKHDQNDTVRQPQADLVPPPIYAEVQRRSNGVQFAETGPTPFYSSVIKQTLVGDTNKHTAMHNSQQTQNIPVYEEVKKIENDEKIHVPGPSGQIQLPTETEPQRQRNYVGADGTQYMELDSLTGLKSNGVTDRKPQMFSVVETYASIDHSMKAPPPPPQLPRRHCY